jgi:hypothetical protein
MAAHDYSPQEAFALLMRKLIERDKDLAAQVQAVVDEGKDVEETELIGSRRKRTRVYRKTVPYSYDEALQAASKAIEAYFIEQPLFASSCLDDIAKAALGIPQRTHQSSDSVIDLKSQGVEKAVQIELRTETQISEPVQETLGLDRAPSDQIKEQQNNLNHLITLIDFGGH